MPYSGGVFDQIPGRVLLPKLTPKDTRQLYAAIKRRVVSHQAGRVVEPLVLLNPDLPVPALECLQRRLSQPGAVSAGDVVLASSGSTSQAGQHRPHLVRLSWDALIASAQATATVLGSAGSWALTLPTHHIAGLQIIVRSVLGGTYPEVLPETNLDAFRSLGTDIRYISLVPTQLARILREISSAGGTHPWERFDSILVGGARLSPALAAAGPPQIVVTYGMTETCGGCVYDGAALPGVKIKVDADQIFIGGPTLLTGYVDEPDPCIREAGQTWLPTADRGNLANGVLEVTGRADDVIISGGENIPATAVGDAITSALPTLGAVEVLGWPDPEWGELVCAVVAGGSGESKFWGPQVRLAAEALLGNRSAPRVVVSLPQLPHLSSGKIDRIKLRELVAASIESEEAWLRW